MERNIVAVQFSNSGKDYHYLTHLDLKVGDQVIVDSPYDGLTVVTVKRVRGHSRAATTKACKWVVQKVELEEYNQLIKREELIQEIKNKLHQRREELEDRRLYMQLAELDPSIKALVDELDRLETAPLQLNGGTKDEEQKN